MFRCALAIATLCATATCATLPLGFSTQTLMHDGSQRKFKAYVPSSSNYTGLFFMNHGWTETMDSACDYGQIQTYAEQYGFVGVCPQGLMYSTGETGWNVGTCCGGAESAETDDVGFIQKVIEFIQAELTIPPGRTFAGGFSNGCSLSFRLACELSHMIHGVGCAGSAYNHRYSGAGVLSCNPTYPRPYWSQVGSGDFFYTVSEAKSGWQQYGTQVLGCSSATSVVFNQDSVTCEEHTSCTGSGRSRFCELAGLGHEYQGSGRSPYQMSPTEAAWLFLTQTQTSSTENAAGETSSGASHALGLFFPAASFLSLLPLALSL